jgi:hypothetical protein
MAAASTSIWASNPAGLGYALFAAFRESPMRWILLLSLLLVAACSRPQPPVGKWEGGYENNGTIVVARVEITANGLVRISAPDITNLQNASPEQMAMQRSRLAAELVNVWADVEPRAFEFDGKTFRKPGGVAPQMVWDKDSNQMTLQLYFGANPALPVVLRPVDMFHDNPFAAG